MLERGGGGGDVTRTLQDGEVVADVGSKRGIEWADANNSAHLSEPVLLQPLAVAVRWEGTVGTNDGWTDTDALAALPDGAFAAVTVHWGLLVSSNPQSVVTHARRYVSVTGAACFELESGVVFVSPSSSVDWQGVGAWRRASHRGGMVVGCIVACCLPAAFASCGCL